MSDLSVLSLISDLSVLSVPCPGYPVCLVCPVCPGCPVCPDDHDNHDYHDDDDQLTLSTVMFILDDLVCSFFLWGGEGVASTPRNFWGRPVKTVTLLCHCVYLYLPCKGQHYNISSQYNKIS